MARAYAGSWRSAPPPLDLTLDEVATIHAHLLRMGGVGLIWPRLRDRASELGAAGMALGYGYQQAAMSNEEVPARIAEALGLLLQGGIYPVLLKGWSVSRHYPFPAVRPSGDIDLLVHPEEFSRAERLVKGHGGLRIDLHHDDMWVDLPQADIRDHTHTLDVAGVRIGVLDAEMQLHVLCYHFIRHSCLRPLWLCDIALALESRPVDFDWDLFLGINDRRRGWVVTALGLAHRLLGAEIDDTPVAEEARRLPDWLAPAVFERWEKGERPPPAVFNALEAGGIVHTFQRRWPEPINATVYFGAPFNNAPRLPIQIASYLHRIAVYAARRLPRHVLERARAHRKRHAMEG